MSELLSGFFIVLCSSKSKAGEAECRVDAIERVSQSASLGGDLLTLRLIHLIVGAHATIGAAQRIKRGVQISHGCIDLLQQIARTAGQQRPQQVDDLAGAVGLAAKPLRSLWL